MASSLTPPFSRASTARTTRTMRTTRATRATRPTRPTRTTRTTRTTTTMRTTQTTQTMPIIILNAGDYQGILAVMHVGIKKQREENSAVINAANIVGKEDEIGGGVMYVQMAGFAFKIKDTLLGLPGMGTRRRVA